MSTYKETV